MAKTTTSENKLKKLGLTALTGVILLSGVTKMVNLKTNITAYADETEEPVVTAPAEETESEEETVLESKETTRSASKIISGIHDSLKETSETNVEHNGYKTILTQQKNDILNLLFEYNVENLSDGDKAYRNSVIFSNNTAETFGSILDLYLEGQNKEFNEILALKQASRYADELRSYLTNYKNTADLYQREYNFINNLDTEYSAKLATFINDNLSTLSEEQQEIAKTFTTTESIDELAYDGMVESPINSLVFENNETNTQLQQYILILENIKLYQSDDSFQLADLQAKLAETEVNDTMIAFDKIETPTDKAVTDVAQKQQEKNDELSQRTGYGKNGQENKNVNSTTILDKNGSTSFESREIDGVPLVTWATGAAGIAGVLAAAYIAILASKRLATKGRQERHAETRAEIGKNYIYNQRRMSRQYERMCKLASKIEKNPHNPNAKLWNAEIKKWIKQNSKITVNNLKNNDGKQFVKPYNLQKTAKKSRNSVFFINNQTTYDGEILNRKEYVNLMVGLRKLAKARVGGYSARNAERRLNKFADNPKFDDFYFGPNSHHIQHQMKDADINEFPIYPERFISKINHKTKNQDMELFFDHVCLAKPNKENKLYVTKIVTTDKFNNKAPYTISFSNREGMDLLKSKLLSLLLVEGIKEITIQETIRRPLRNETHLEKTYPIAITGDLKGDAYAESSRRELVNFIDYGRLAMFNVEREAAGFPLSPNDKEDKKILNKTENKSTEKQSSVKKIAAKVQKVIKTKNTNNTIATKVKAKPVEKVITKAEVVEAKPTTESIVKPTAEDVKIEEYSTTPSQIKETLGEATNKTAGEKDADGMGK